MPATPLPLGTIALDADAAAPLYRQLYDALREAILEGRLAPGARLPSSRLLASELGVGRNTVLAAYDQLTAEGYLEGQVGAGTVVAATLPDSMLQLDRQAQGAKPNPADANSRQLSKRGQALSATRRLTPGYARGIGKPFQHGLPAIDEFPAMLWSRLLARHSRDTRTALFGYETGTGVEALREAIAVYAGAARGVTCTKDQVIVTVGAQGALDLAARMLLDPGDPVWVEDPGYLGARGALLGAGASLVPVPADEEGLDVAQGIARHPAPRLIYVTPSHQFPLGATLSLPRRLALIDHARQCGAFILEDDYDSEYRYQGRPIASLQGLDKAGTVIYMGTFAKTLFPALKLGYLIVPQSLVDAFAAAIRISGHVPPSAVQAALADFMAEGHYGAHIRRMRAIYAARRACLMESLGNELAPWLRAAPGEGGLQLSAFLPPGAGDRAMAAAATAAGLHVSPLSLYRLEEGPPGLYMGYASIPEPALKRGARELADVLRANRCPTWR
ncbi:PLP-dependent aminotransferase family protein [Parvibaculum sp.]|uniref:MocR-like pyridoxine biosynthesis transcription factor PdxR n=1 Tax=Parvibaculum sp. TaxID=2024848 RepID=UPI00391DC938